MTTLECVVICASILPSIASADMEIDTSIDFTKLNRSAFVDAADALTQATWEPTFVLFARVDPAIAEAVPSYQRGEEFRVIHGCIFDTLSKQDALNEMNIVRDKSVKALAYLDANPDLNLSTVAEHNEYLDNAVPPDAYVAAAQSCGLFDINADIVKEAGLFELMLEAAKNEN